MTEPSESTKIKILTEAGFKLFPVQEKYLKLLEFLKETDFIDLPIEKLKEFAKIPDDSYLRLQAEYVLSLKEFLKEIGEM